VPPAAPLTVIVPWCNRDEIAVTMTRNEPEFRKVNAEVLLINSGGALHDLLNLRSRHGWTSVKVVDAHLPAFNKSFAMNIGVHLSSAPVVMILDADVLVTADLMQNALCQVQDQTFVTVEWMHESAAPDTVSEMARIDGLAGAVRTNYLELRFANGTQKSVCTYRFNEFTASRTGISQIFLRKEHFLEIGGYNSALKRWGWEDNDLHLRLLWPGKLRHIETGHVIHLSHGDERRALLGIGQQAALKENMTVCLRRYAQNNLQGTYLVDVEEWESRSEDRNGTSGG
jgi:Glycosyltransferase like family 2